MVKKRPVEIRDLFSLQMISDPQISPNGEYIAFVLSLMDYEKDEYLSNIWMTDTKTGKSEQFTSGRGKDKNPRWSPDGKKLLFTSTPSPKDGEEKKKSQIYIINVSGGEAKKITDQRYGVEAPKWSADGKQILFISPTKDNESKSDVKHITRLSYKYNARGFFPNEFKHIFTVRMKGGKSKQLTKGDFEVKGAEWLGEKIMFIGNTALDADREDYDHLYIIDNEKLSRLSAGDWHLSSLESSPDNNSIAFTGHDYKRGGATKQDIWITPIKAWTPRKLTTDFNQDVGVKLSSDVRVSSNDPSPLWHRDGFLYFTSTFNGISRLNKVKDSGGEVCKVLGEVDRSVEAWGINRDGVIAYTDLSTTKSSDLWLRVSGKDKQLTDLNRKWYNSLDLRPHERFEFKSSAGHFVEGWIMKPTGFRKGKKYPLLVEIHGGPRGAYGHALMHEFQLLAGQGWGVMYINPWGSGGYTEDFQAGLPGHYGEQDYLDIMEAVDYCLKNYDWIDPIRLGVLGGSYGGFMTNWIVTHTNRFKAAVTMRSISNWISFFGTSDIGWTFGKRELIGLPWEDEEVFMAKSPIRYVKNCKTPTLVIHSEEDYRCPMEQGEQFYTALKYLGVPTEFVRFPGENHELSRSGKPKHREERLMHIVQWFKTYLNDTTATSETS